MSKLKYFVTFQASLHAEFNNKILLGKISTPDISHMGNINSTLLQYKKSKGWTGLLYKVYTR